jgi:hypothetical protein
MKNKLVFLVIGILIIGALIGNSLGLFSITGNERMSRYITSNTADPGETITISYTVTGTSGQWGATVIDTMTCPGIGNQEKKFVVISDEGIAKTMTFTLPNAEGVTCTLTGNYQFGDKSLLNFPTQTISTRITTISHSYKSCYDNDVYWYNSKNVLEDKYQECGVPGCFNGACKVQNTPADTNYDGVVDRTELGLYITKWISGTVSRDQLGIVIQAWAI